MTSEPISVRAEPRIECRSCGAGSPVDDHFCQQCSRILALGRHGNYFTFVGLPRRLNIDLPDLAQRFRDMSRQLHPDFFHNAPTNERLASLERTSYLNDAYRTLRDPVRLAEYLLSLEGMPTATGESAEHAKVPPALLEEVFALNEELDGIREMREAGASAAELRKRVEAARQPIEQKRVEHEQQLGDLGAEWDALGDDVTREQRRHTLERLREVLFERKYISNLLATVDREVMLIHG